MIDPLLLCAVAAKVDMGIVRVEFRNEVRRVGRYKDAPCLVLEFIGVRGNARNTGACSSVLDYMEGACAIANKVFIVENVLSKKLAEMLKKRGYRAVKGTMPRVSSYYLPSIH